MAGEGKGKHGKRRSPSVSEDGGGRSKRMKEDKKKELSKKSSKGSRDDSEKKKKLKEKRHHKHHRKHSQDSNFKDLSDDDYFSKNNEFSTWLKEEKGVFFSDLSSEDSRKLFSKFVKDWNSHKLDSRYYEGIASAARTAHKWNIVKEN